MAGIKPTTVHYKVELTLFFNDDPPKVKITHADGGDVSGETADAIAYLIRRGLDAQKENDDACDRPFS